MKTPSIAVIDYGVGNLFSVERALEASNAKVDFITEEKQIKKADRIILPGVGAFGKCMTELKSRNLIQGLFEYIQCGRPFLGICVGMQVLHTVGQEFGKHLGLGIIPGSVEPIPSHFNGNSYKVPFVGWAEIFCLEESPSALFKGIMQGDAFYFVHSFMALTQDKSHTKAHYNYGDIKITAAVGRENIFGCQFHPEKSGVTGLKFLRNFLLL